VRDRYRKDAFEIVDLMIRSSNGLGKLLAFARSQTRGLQYRGLGQTSWCACKDPEGLPT
jgi:hypothetical protein